MGLAVVAKSGSGVGPRSRVLLPVQDGLKIVHYFGSTEAMSKKNLADINLVDGSFTNAFTVNAGSVSLPNSSMFTDTGAVGSANGTIIVAVKGVNSDYTAAANRPNFGGFQIPGGEGFSIYVGGNTVVRAGAKIGGTQVVANITTTVAQINSWNIWAATVQEGVGINFYNFTTGQTATLANAGTRNVIANNYTMGGTTGLTGALEMAGCIVYNRALSLAELQADVLVFKKRLTEVNGLII